MQDETRLRKRLDKLKLDLHVCAGVQLLSWGMQAVVQCWSCAMLCTASRKAEHDPLLRRRRQLSGGKVLTYTLRLAAVHAFSICASRLSRLCCSSGPSALLCTAQRCALASTACPVVTCGCTAH